MKKLYLLSLSAFVSGNSERINAVKIFFLAFIFSCISYSGFAQVIISPANDTLICSKTAVSGSAPSCTALGPIAINETIVTDFSTGADQIVLSPPAGWQFCTVPAPVITHTPGDVTASTGTITSTSLTINITVIGNGSLDQITITGLQVQPLTTSSAAGFIYASSSSGINGIVTGTGGGASNFGNLAEIPAPITGFSSICKGDTIQFGDVTPGGVWSSSNGNVFVTATGQVVGEVVGASNVIYTVAGCAATFAVSVLKTPANIIGLHDACAFSTGYYIHDVDSPGVFQSTGLTVTAIKSIYGLPETGTGFVSINYAGIDTVTFTMIPSGCTVTDTITVWPLPNPITGTDTMCQGSSSNLSDNIAGGVWSSFNTAIATVGSTTGTVTGVTPGTTTIYYTLPTGCNVSTVVTVLPIPDTITGTPNACLGLQTDLSDATVGGIWSSSNPLVGTVDPHTGVVYGAGFGTDTITYTLPTGCSVMITITVNPVPAPIVPSATQECQGDSSIILTDITPAGTWVSSNVGIGTIDQATGAVYGVSGGVDTVSYALSTGCSSTITVTINPLPTPIFGPDSVCVGSVITLSDSTSGIGTTWSSSNTNIAFVDPVGFVTGKGIGGVATITYTLGTGCFVTYTITVNPIPASITGTNVICLGSNTTLSDPTTGGYWSSNTLSVGTIDPVTGVLTGVGVGSTTVTYTLVTGGCNATYGVTVTPVPTGIVGDTTVCASQTITLAGIPPGGTWSTSNTTVGTITVLTGVFTGDTAGTDTVIYSLGAGCLFSEVITVFPFGSISGPSTVCQGDSILLTDSAALGGTWTSSNTTIATVDSASAVSGYVTGIAPGTDTITFFTSAGCTTTWTITVNPLAPITGPDSVCVGDSITLSDAVAGGVWSSGLTSVATIGSTTGVVIAKGSGTVTFFYVLPTGCLAVSNSVVVNPLPNRIFGPDYVCQRDSVTLVDSNNTVGLGDWSSGNLAIGTIDPISGVFTGISPGLDTITYTLFTGGCSIKDTIRVDPIAFITGIDSMCVGATTTLTDTTAGGVWISSNTTVATVGTSGVVTGLVAGTSDITYLLPTGCSAFVTVTVDPIPGVITGIDSVCQGSTTTLSDTPVGGAWTSGRPGVAIIDPFSGVVTGISAGTTTITYTLTAGACTATTVVTVNPIPSPITPDPANVCLGFTVPLFDGTPGGVWSSANTIISTISVTGVDTGKSPGVDTIFYTLPITGCQVYDTVTVHAPPVISVATPPQMCKGASDTLTATGADVGGTLGTYSWSPAYGLSCVSCNPTIASPTITTTYTVIGTNKYGCADTTTVTVLVDSLLNHLKILGKDTICAGSFTIDTAIGNIVSHFAWTPADGLSCTICDTVRFSPDVTTKYEATAIDPFGCKDSISITIYVLPLPLLTVYAEPHIFPITLCRGTPIQLLAFGAWSYVWSPNLFLSCDSCANPVASDTFNMVYQLTGYNEFGCADSIPVKISVLDTNFNIISGDTAICVGTSAQLSSFSHSVTGNLDEPTYLWTPSTGLSNPDISNPIATPDTTTTYTLVITENGCFKDTGTVKVSVEPYPVINLTPLSETVFAGTAVQMIALVTNTPVQSYVWSPANTVSCDTCFNPIVTPTATTTQYTVIVTSIYGCVSQDTVTINIGCNSGQVFIPNMFTPNGDGMNDYFYVSAKGLKIITTFMVFNRWGQVVFEAHNINPNDPNAGWDGTYKGVVLEPDVFMYVVDAICEFGTPFKYKGDVSLVR